MTDITEILNVTSKGEKERKLFFILFLTLLPDTIHKEMEARKRKGKWVELFNIRLQGEPEVAFSISSMFSSNSKQLSSVAQFKL